MAGQYIRQSSGDAKWAALRKAALRKEGSGKSGLQRYPRTKSTTVQKSCSPHPGDAGQVAAEETQERRAHERSKPLGSKKVNPELPPPSRSPAQLLGIADRTCWGQPLAEMNTCFVFTSCWGMSESTVCLQVLGCFCVCFLLKSQASVWGFPQLKLKKWGCLFAYKVKAQPNLFSLIFHWKNDENDFFC